jgi:hypothetical protein
LPAPLVLRVVVVPVLEAILGGVEKTVGLGVLVVRELLPRAIEDLGEGLDLALEVDLCGVELVA